MQQAKSSKARYSKGFIFENCHNLNRIAIADYRAVDTLVTSHPRMEEGMDEVEYVRKHNIKYLYHMTAISNLRSILQHGLLSHKEAHRLELVMMDISDPEVQRRRDDKKDTIYSRLLHDYVPLYFSPRNPMLYRRREIQENIVILGIKPEVIFKANTVFSDGNAASKGTIFYNDVAMLDSLCWNIINALNWSDFPEGKRIKCAEVLVYPKIDVKNIVSIFCYSGNQLSTIHETIRYFRAIPLSLTISVQVKPELFF